MQIDPLKRREFITLLGGAAAWPVRGLAQQSPLPVIGWLGARAAHESAYLVGAFRQGLKEAGFIEPQNVTLDFRWGEGDYDRLPAYATELARRPVMVIVTTGGEIPPPKRRRRRRQLFPLSSYQEVTRSKSDLSPASIGREAI
jgi:hypothetical protein